MIAKVEFSLPGPSFNARLRFLFALIVAVLLAGCNQQPTQQQAPTVAIPNTTALPKRPNIQPIMALADTAFPYTALWSRPNSVPTQVSIGGVTYRIEATADPDSTRPLQYTYPPAAKAPVIDSTTTRTVSGTEVVYTFRILKPNGQSLFTRRLLKSSFGAAIGQDLATEAAPWPPDFLGYLPHFKAFAFELTLNPPDSDSGGSLLLLLDARTGQVRQQRLSRWNGGCNSPVALSENGRTLLTSFDIIQANGRVTNFEKPELSIGGTLFVNDETVLIEYVSEQEGSERPTVQTTRNARLLDLNGHLLASFSLESFDGGLGTQMQATYIGQTRTYYLFDENGQQLGLLPHSQPTAMRVVKLHQLTPFQAPQQPTEVRFYIDTESGMKGSFYIDTISKQVRYHVFKPTY